MSKVCLVGTAQHKLGVHSLHLPDLWTDPDPQSGRRRILTVTFQDGVADVNSNVRDYLKDKGIVSEVMIEAIDLGRPGTPAILDHDPETGEAVVVAPAVDAPAAKAEPKK